MGNSILTAIDAALQSLPAADDPELWAWIAKESGFKLTAVEIREAEKLQAVSGSIERQILEYSQERARVSWTERVEAAKRDVAAGRQARFPTRIEVEKDFRQAAESLKEVGFGHAQAVMALCAPILHRFADAANSLAKQLASEKQHAWNRGPDPSAVAWQARHARRRTELAPHWGQTPARLLKGIWSSK